jgi:hypothetical protein
MLLTSDLAAAGASRRELEAMRSDNSKLTRGVYVSADIDPWDRHGLLAQAVLSRLRPGACITGPSAAHAWELPLPSKPPAEVTVRNIARGTYGPQIRVVHGDAEYVERNGLLVATPAWTVADCARLLSRRDALIVADAVLHEELCREADLWAVCARLKGSRGVARVRWVIENADPHSESPGETWTRMIVKQLGYEVTSQHVVVDGDFHARLDLLLEDGRTALEFDGVEKYRKPTGQTVERKVVNEKNRDARLQVLGYAVLHFLWGQLFQPRHVDLRLRSAGAHPTRSPLLLPADFCW